MLCPNKHNAKYEAMFKGHLLDSETYIGGKVEALESGVFRSDLSTRFKLQPDAYQVPAPCSSALCPYHLPSRRRRKRCSTASLAYSIRHA